ncbi:hypothetical protein J6590_018825 [Homalodisca vitripennis]|nr:hypothetical protein J6590_018825 [Homalodisca vitripennis]
MGPIDGQVRYNIAATMLTVSVIPFLEPTRRTTVHVQYSVIISRISPYRACYFTRRTTVHVQYSVIISRISPYRACYFTRRTTVHVQYSVIISRISPYRACYHLTTDNCPRPV